MSTQQEAIMEQIVRHLNGEATDAEREFVEKWKTASSENNRYFDEVASVWENTENAADFVSIDVDKQWERFVTQTQLTKPKPRVLSLVTVWSVAAAVLVLIGTTFYFNGVFSDQITLMAVSGEENRFVLPDGSTVWLNDNSELSYTKNFGGEEGKVRSLELHGEAYFDVVKNPKKPFEIQVNDTKTKVLGTSFNLKEDRGSNTVSLDLINGKVAFSSATAEEVVSPGEHITATANGVLTKQTFSDLNFLAWKTGVLSFEKTPLKKALVDIAIFYNINIQSDTEQFKDCTLTIQLKGETIEDVMETLKILFKLSYTKEASGNYKLNGGGC